MSSRKVQVLVIEVNPGQEIIETVTSELSSRGVLRGAIVSLVGAIDSCCISNMPKDDAKSDILTEYRQPFEMAGTGEIKEACRTHIASSDAMATKASQGTCTGRA